MLCVCAWTGGPLASGTETALPLDGFAKDLKWNIQQTGLHEDKRGEYPYVTIEISDTEATRAVLELQLKTCFRFGLAATTDPGLWWDAFRYTQALGYPLGLADFMPGTHPPLDIKSPSRLVRLFIG